MDGGYAILFFTAGLVAFLFLYFLPGLVADHRHHHQRGSIWVINLLLGWTLLGWVVALALACSMVKPPERAC